MATREERIAGLEAAIAEAEATGGVVSYSTPDGQSYSVDLEWLTKQLAKLKSGSPTARRRRRRVLRYSRGR